MLKDKIRKLKADGPALIKVVLTLISNTISFLKAFRLYIYNKVLNKIPFSLIRNFFTRRYISLGRHSNILLNVELLNVSLNKKQIEIGCNSIINTRCLLDGRQGRIIMGNNVDIARETNIFTLQHDPNDDYHRTKSGDVIIEDYVWVSSRVTILPGVKIGKGAVVASNSVVTKDVEPMTIAAGIPAKKIGVRKSGLKYTLKHFPYFS